MSCSSTAVVIVADKVCEVRLLGRDQVAWGTQHHSSSAALRVFREEQKQLDHHSRLAAAWNTCVHITSIQLLCVLGVVTILSNKGIHHTFNVVTGGTLEQRYSVLLLHHNFHSKRLR
jgi:hypothetical protein